MKSIKDLIYNNRRNCLIKRLTCNMGKVVEEEDSLVCYVVNNKIKNGRLNSKVTCYGIGDCEREVAEQYGLNKKICYVIDGLNTYNRELCVFGYNDCEIILKNCNFRFNAVIVVGGKLILDNTSIAFFSTSSVYANEIVLRNIGNGQIDSFCFDANIRFCGRDSINIENSFLDNQRIKLSFLDAKKLIMCHSKVFSKKIVCDVETIIADDNSLLGASEEVNLTVNDFSSVKVDAPRVILNGNDVLHNDKLFTLRRLRNQLEIKRMNLLNVLNQISIKCQENNSRKVLDYQQRLDNTSVGKVLKRVK